MFTLWDATQIFLIIVIPLWLVFLIILITVATSMKKKSPLKVAIVFTSIYACSATLACLLCLLAQGGPASFVVFLFYLALNFPIDMIFTLTKLDTSVLSFFNLSGFQGDQFFDFSYHLVLGGIQFFIIGLLVGKLLDIKPRFFDGLFKFLREVRGDSST